MLPGFLMNEDRNPTRPIRYLARRPACGCGSCRRSREETDSGWLPSTERSPPRQIPNVEGDGPLFLSNAEVVFRGREGDYGFAYRVRTDGTELRRASNHPVIRTTGVSRDGQWLVVSARPSEEKAGGTLALPLGGGSPSRSLDGSRGSHGPRVGGSCCCRRVLSYPLEPPISSRCHAGEAFPTIPAQGLLSTPKRLPACLGYRSLTCGFASGPTPGVFAVSRITVQLNIYRLPIP